MSISYSTARLIYPGRERAELSLKRGDQILLLYLTVSDHHFTIVILNPPQTANQNSCLQRPNLLELWRPLRTASAKKRNTETGRWNRGGRDQGVHQRKQEGEKKRPSPSPICSSTLFFSTGKTRICESNYQLLFLFRICSFFPSDTSWCLEVKIIFERAT